MSLSLPAIDPVIFQYGIVSIRWYGLSYLIGFLGAWFFAARRMAAISLTDKELSDLVFYIAIGVILGGRIGYELFYAWSELLKEPWQLFLFWEPGRSFHGGLMGVIAAIALFAWHTHKPLSEIADFIAPLAPLGIAFGRLGNFFNQELWGRVTDVPWAVIYPYVDKLPRHPSQLYESILEGFVLFGLLWWYSKKSRQPWHVSAWFLIGYGVMRFFCEWFREPDQHLGFIGFDWLTMGQLLTIPMVMIGIGLLYKDRACKLISHC